MAQIVFQTEVIAFREAQNSVHFILLTFGKTQVKIK